MTTPRSAEWVAAQNAHTRAALDARPDRSWWHERIVALMQLPVVLAAQVRGEHLFCLERPAGAEQFLLTRRSAVDASVPPVVLLDPAAGVADAANAIDWFEASADGALVAVGTSEGGTEDSVLRVLDSADGRDLGEAIPNTRACSVAWEPDGSGFAYTRYPEGDEYHRTVHHHRLGDDWRDDPVVWAEHPDPQAWPDVTMSPDGRWLLVHVLVGWARYDVHLLDRRADEWSTVIAGVEATSEFQFAADGDALVGVTTLDAPRGRLVRVPFGAADPGRWETLVPEGEGVLSHPTVCGDDVLAVSTAARRRPDRPLRRRRQPARIGRRGRRRGRRHRADRRPRDRSGLRRRRLVRRADRRVAGRSRHDRDPLVPTPRRRQPPCRPSPSARSPTPQPTARRSGCSSSTATTWRQARTCR